MGEVWGDDGLQWLERLPDILADCERRWLLTVGPPFTSLSYNYAAPAERADGTRAVLKLSFPGEKEFRSEAAALQVFEGRGIAQLLEVDLDTGAMLLERLEPGTPLEKLVRKDDEQATTVATSIMRELWRLAPADGPFPTVEQWGTGFTRLLRARFDGGTGPLPAALVEEAERLFMELAGSAAKPVLLHGDLHHGNILEAQREPWLAIDPKGVLGEPAYETGSLLRNPWPHLLSLPNPGKVLARRIDQMAGDLGFDRERIRAWGFAQAVLSAVWVVDDGGSDWHFSITCAQLLRDIKV